MLLPDHETAVDYLNCEAIANAVVTVLTDNPAHPMTVGVHGGWGAGKSSILRMAEAALHGKANVEIIWFNGWAVEGFDHAKIALVEAIVTKILDKHEKNASLKKRAFQLLKRVDWLKLGLIGGVTALNASLGIPLSDLTSSAVGLTVPEQSERTSSDAESRNNRPKAGDNSLTRSGAASISKNILAIRQDFEEMLKAGGIDQLIVIIDDLDRCLPQTTIQTLEAIRLLLFVPHTAFIIGADETMIEYAVQEHFPNLHGARELPSHAKSYLEKLIQVPFRILALGEQEVLAYITLLLVQQIVGEHCDGFQAFLDETKKRLLQPWNAVALTQENVEQVSHEHRAELRNSYTIAQRIARILAEGTRGNPRQIKRFLNAWLLRKIIARAKGFGETINDMVLVKLMLAERFEPDLYDSIALMAMNSQNGKVPVLSVPQISNGGTASSEAPSSDIQVGVGTAKSVGSDARQQEEPPNWLQGEWVQRWLNLEPALDSVDLRPYVFVARSRRFTP